VEDQWKKIISEKVPDIIDVDELGADSQELLQAGMRPEAFIRELTAEEKWSDAVKVMARALPPREAVWWACVCARQSKTVLADKSEVAALQAAEKWVFKPTDDHRWAAFEAAKVSTLKSLGTLSALAVAFSGGKLPVSEDQFMEMDNAAFPEMVGAVVMSAVCEKQGEEMIEQFKISLRSGEDIACGGNGQIKTTEA